MMKRGMQKIQGPPDSYDSDFRSNVALFAFAMKICEQIGGNYQDSLALASLPIDQRPMKQQQWSLAPKLWHTCLTSLSTKSDSDNDLLLAKKSRTIEEFI